MHSRKNVGLTKALRYRLAKPWRLGDRALRLLDRTPPVGSFRVLLIHDVPRGKMVAFERLLLHVLDSYGVVTPEEAETGSKEQRLSGTDDRIPYLFTFDDGFKSNLLVAREILDRHGVKAIFFVCPGLMDVPREQQREAIATYILNGNVPTSGLSDEMGLMSWPDLEALITSGHAIGSHTLHHQRLSRLSADQKESEIVGSAKLLSSRLGAPVKWFAYPFGDLQSIDRISLEIIARQYVFCCSGIRGVNSANAPPLGLLREELALGSPFEYQKLILQGGLDFWYALRALRLQTMAEAQHRSVKYL